MDFEKEAREIAYGLWCGNCEGPSAKPCKKHEGCYELILETEQALRRAFIAGQIDMRERAEKRAARKQREVVRDNPQHPDNILARRHNATALSISNAISSLPTLDNPIQNSGKEMK